MKRRKAVSVARVKGLFRTLPVFEGLGGTALDRLVRGGKVESLGSGRTLFEPGDPADRIHVVLQGALEILRESPDRAELVPTAYLTPGEVVGALAVLTGTARRCVGRVPESAVVWTMRRGPFETFARSVPGYWQEFARAIAVRLETLASDEEGLGSAKDLTGRLEFFDLPTVVQTLASSRQTGILSLSDEEGNALANVLLLDGEVERARCGESDGEEAFLEILMAGAGTRFHFRTVADPDPDRVGLRRVEPTTMNLLVDAARRADEGRRGAGA